MVNPLLASQETRRQALHRFLEEKTDLSTVESLQAIVELFLQEVAERALPVIHREMQKYPVDSPAAKREVAKQLGVIVGSLRLAIASPDDGDAAYLVGVGSDNEKTGRFMLRKVRGNDSASSWAGRVKHLEDLRLRPNKPRELPHHSR